MQAATSVTFVPMYGAVLLVDTVQAGGDVEPHAGAMTSANSNPITYRCMPMSTLPLLNVVRRTCA